MEYFNKNGTSTILISPEKSTEFDNTMSKLGTFNIEQAYEPYTNHFFITVKKNKLLD